MTEVLHPGYYVKEALEKRGWTQQVLCDVIDRPPRLISEIIHGRRAISPKTAIDFSAALGGSPEYWLGLESAFQLSRIRKRL